MVIISRAPIEWCIGKPRSSSIVSYNIILISTFTTTQQHNILILIITLQVLTKRGPNFSACYTCRIVKRNCELAQCAACTTIYYCSEPCQHQDHPRHRFYCDWNKGLGRDAFPEYFVFNWKNAVPCPKVFHLAEMKRGPDQPMDPPLQLWPTNGETQRAWQETLSNDEVGPAYYASLIPPNIKKAVREGLRTKGLTWEYLASNVHFMPLLYHAALPVKKAVELLQKMARAEIKEDPAMLMETLLSSFWLSQINPAKEDQYVPAMSITYRDCKITPNQISLFGRSMDPLRVHTHEPSCQCRACVNRSRKEESTKNLWEEMRMKEEKGGKMSTSYALHKEISDHGHTPTYQKLFDICDRSAKAQAEEDAAKKMKGYRKPKLAKGEPRICAGLQVILDTEWELDNAVPDNVLLSPARQVEVERFLDSIHDEKRLPTPLEIDKLVKMLSEPEPPRKVSSSSSSSSSSSLPSASSSSSANAMQSSQKITPSKASAPRGKKAFRQGDSSGDVEEEEEEGEEGEADSAILPRRR